MARTQTRPRIRAAPPSPDNTQRLGRDRASDNHPDICFIERTFDTDQWEAELEYLTVFVQIVGTRPTVEPQTARRAIAAAFHLQEASLEISRVAPPEDYVVKFPNRGAMLLALQGDRLVHTPAFSLLLKPWSRLANAEHGTLYHKVQIELEGIPLHVWNYTTAADLLRPYCSIESIDPLTEGRHELRVFKVIARTTRPEFIPESRILAVPEPAHVEAPFHLERRYLKYVIRIHVRRLLVRLPPDSPPCSPPPTPPSDSSSEEGSPPQNPKLRRRGRRTACCIREDTPMQGEGRTSRRSPGAQASSGDKNPGDVIPYFAVNIRTRPRPTPLSAGHRDEGRNFDRMETNGVHLDHFETGRVLGLCAASKHRRLTMVVLGRVRASVRRG